MVISYGVSRRNSTQLVRRTFQDAFNHRSPSLPLTFHAYFIDFNKFQYYRALHGFLIGNFKIQSSGTYGFEKLADASVLKICGYTVNQGEALSSLERKTILKGLIDREILTKQRVMSYLKFFINNSQNRKKHEICRFKVG